MEHERLLEFRHVCKYFPGVKALEDINVDLYPGEVHILVGENGAGKSTLMMTLAGIYKPDAGEIRIKGRQVQFNNARDAINEHIGIVFQELNLVPQLSIAENIYFNRQPCRFGMVDAKKMNEDAQKMLDMFHMKNISPKKKVGDLSIANMQVVEILKAMSEDPEIIILDEPTSSLTEQEKAHLFEILKELKSKGMSFIYISHHLSEIFEIADTVTVLRDGEKITEAKVADVDEDFLISNMVGRSIGDIYGSRDPKDKIGEKIFEARNLSGERFENVSFHINAGEIVGFSGLVGAGRTEVGRAIFGADRLKGGEIWLKGEKVHIKSPDEAIKKGIAYMTEDRKELGLYLQFSLVENIAANRLGDFAPRGLMNDTKCRKECERCVQDFNISTPSPYQKAGNLSGGNQQKVLLASWLGINPSVLIVDEPTRGVDIGAKHEIYIILRRMARELGCAIMMISSDLPEVMGVSDRIYVMKDGHITGELQKDQICEEAVMKLAAGTEE